MRRPQTTQGVQEGQPAYLLLPSRCLPNPGPRDPCSGWRQVPGGETQAHSRQVSFVSSLQVSATSEDSLYPFPSWVLQGGAAQTGEQAKWPGGHPEWEWGVTRFQSWFEALGFCLQSSDPNPGLQDPGLN